MKIIWEEASIRKIKELIGDKEGYLKFIYDTEDCGCDDGVSTLWYIKEPEGDEAEVETNGGPLLIDKDKLIYLEEEMRISYEEDGRNTFRLTSPAGIINPYMRFYNWVK